MSTLHINSRHFMRLVQQGDSNDYLSGHYHFDTLHSGISLHGGRATAEQDLHCSRLTDAYVNFVILLEGRLDFGINRERYCIRADGGKVILVAAGEEILFSRYLHRGETTVKIALKGIEHWLSQPQYRHLLSHVYREPVRSWPLDDGLAVLVRRCLQRPDGSIADALQQEADALQLLAGLWRDFLARHPVQTACEVSVPSESFVHSLNHAFDNGAHQVAELAAALHISERTLQRRLRESFGITASDWLRHKHMQYALYALTTGQESISETAYRCGYRHTSSFTQAFKQYFDCTPAEMQRRGRE